MKKSRSWSASAILSFESCPRQYKAKYIERRKGPPSAVMQRGTDIHAMAESFLLGRTRGLPDELQKLAKQFRNLKKTKPLCELKIALDADWKTTTWQRGWLRAVLDVMTRLDDEGIVIDHKTGRVYSHHDTNAEVYAIVGDAAMRDIASVHVEFWYIDQGITRSWNFDESDVAKLRIDYANRVDKMLNASKYPATPSEHACRFCPASSKNGGPCRAWKKL